MYKWLRRLVPGVARRHVLHFECEIERAVGEFAARLPTRARVLDAGAGEGGHRAYFKQQRYYGIDLAIGDEAWDYSRLDALGDLGALPFVDRAFDAALNVVTLEHVAEPGQVLAEIGRTLRSGGELLLIAPLEWEEHQQPHDYYRYTRYGLRYLLEKAGFGEVRVEPVGGFFRLLARRLWNGLQFFPGPVALLAAVVIAPLALLVPFLDGMDTRRNFTLGFICYARRL
jgi:SAM-dependent methyltransferase